MKQDKILIVGAGAIGAFYGSLLAKAGAEVAVLCRSDYHTAKQQGYYIESDEMGRWTFKPSQIIKKATDYQEQADFIIICTKIVPETNRVHLIQPAVNKKSSIVLIQNGINIEEEILAAFPDNNIISGLAFICCNRIAPARIHHLAYGKLTLGSLNKDNREAEHLCKLFIKAGIEALSSSDIVGSRWLKCLWNAAFNPLSVLSDGLSTAQILNSQEDLVRVIMQEVASIAEASGHPLPIDSIDNNIASTYAMPPYKTSMLLDYQKGQSMEIEAILGNAIKAARKYQITCPTLNTLYALMNLKALHITQMHSQTTSYATSTDY